MPANRSENSDADDERPLVSVVVPCYNGARYVRLAVGSALAQNYPNIEVIVVDDGSTDDSVELLRRTFGDRVKLISISNSGPSAARNVGLKAAGGDYIQFLDADNMITREKVARSMACFRDRPGTDLVFTAIHEPRRHDFTDESDFSAEELQATLDKMRWRTYDLVLPGTGMLALETSQPVFRRAALVECGGWDEDLTVMEDTELVCRMAMRGAVIEPVEYVGVLYRDHPGERVTRRMRFDNADYFRTVLKMIELTRATGRMSGAIENFSLKYLVWIAALECVRHGSRAEAERYLAVAAEIRPSLTGPWVFRWAARVLGPVPALSVVGALVNVGLRVAPRRTRALFHIPEPD